MTMPPTILDAPSLITYFGKQLKPLSKKLKDTWSVRLIPTNDDDDDDDDHVTSIFRVNFSISGRDPHFDLWVLYDKSSNKLETELTSCATVFSGDLDVVIHALNVIKSMEKNIASYNDTLAKRSAKVTKEIVFV